MAETDKAPMVWQNKITFAGLIILVVLGVMSFNGLFLDGILKFLFFIPLICAMFTAYLVFGEEKEIKGRIYANIIPFVMIVASLGFFIYLFSKKF